MRPAGVPGSAYRRGCLLGLVGPRIPETGDQKNAMCSRECEIDLITVVSPSHPLPGKRRAITAATVAKEVQLVLSDRTTLSEGRDFGVLSPLTWRLADLGAKHAFLKAGLGWGHMPLHMVKADLDTGALVRIRVEDFPRNPTMSMKVVYRKDAPPGPAGRAFIDQLRK